jgi:hypothetical protein
MAREEISKEVEEVLAVQRSGVVPIAAAPAHPGDGECIR